MVQWEVSVLEAGMEYLPFQWSLQSGLLPSRHFVFWEVMMRGDFSPKPKSAADPQGKNSSIATACNCTLHLARSSSVHKWTPYPALLKSWGSLVSCLYFTYSSFN